MNILETKTRAKINLTLDVMNKRIDGYHNVKMVMQTIDLYDELTYSLVDKGIYIKCDDYRVPTNEDNLIYRAAELLAKEYSVKKGVIVSVNKNIPISAGLAGGSTNAAGTLMSLNRLWEINECQEKLMRLGSKIGADVPFCMLGGTALAEGKGDKLFKLPNLPPFYVVLVKPDISICTSWAYDQIDVDSINVHPNNDDMICAINNNDKVGIVDNLGNVFEDIIIRRYPEILTIKQNLKKLGANAQLMSGSGPTVYGLFTKEEIALLAYNTMNKKYKEVFIVQTFN